MIHSIRQQMAKAAGAPTTRWRTSWPLATRAYPTTWAPSPSPPGTGSTRWSGSSRAPTTTTARFSPRPWPTGWRRRSPSGCTSGCAGSSGATRPDESLANDQLIKEEYQGIRPAPGYPACPDHTEKGHPLRIARCRSPYRRPPDRELCDDAHRRGERLVFLAPRGALLRGGQDRARPGRGLRAAQGHVAGRSGALAVARTSATRGARGNLCLRCASC